MDSKIIFPLICCLAISSALDLNLSCATCIKMNLAFGKSVKLNKFVCAPKEKLRDLQVTRRILRLQDCPKEDKVPVKKEEEKPALLIPTTTTTARPPPSPTFPSSTTTQKTTTTMAPIPSSTLASSTTNLPLPSSTVEPASPFQEEEQNSTTFLPPWTKFPKASHPHKIIKELECPQNAKETLEEKHQRAYCRIILLEQLHEKKGKPNPYPDVPNPMHMDHDKCVHLMHNYNHCIKKRATASPLTSANKQDCTSCLEKGEWYGEYQNGTALCLKPGAPVENVKILIEDKNDCTLLPEQEKASSAGWIILIGIVTILLGCGAVFGIFMLYKMFMTRRGRGGDSNEDIPLQRINIHGETAL